MSIEAENINVVQDTQENYIIYDREISQNPDPQFNDNILITNDHLSNRLYFNMYYTFDDRELDNKEISIVWINANNEKGMSLCVDKSLKDNRLTFAWNVPKEATYQAGYIFFAVRITTDNYIWNSLAGSVEVKRGLVTEEYNSLADAQLEPGWVDYIEGKYKLYLAKLTESEYNALETKDKDCLYLVTTSDDSVYQYLGDTLVSGGGATSDVTDNTSITRGIISAPSSNIYTASWNSSTNVEMITIKSGLKYRIPNGFNEDGSRAYIEKTLESDVSVGVGQEGRNYLVLDKDGNLTTGYNKYFVSYNSYDSVYTNIYSNANHFIYRPLENKTYTSTSSATNKLFLGCVIGYVDIYTSWSSSSYTKSLERVKIWSSAQDLPTFDEINHLIEQKPGINYNGRLVYSNSNGMSAQQFTRHCAVFNNDDESNYFKISGYYNTLFGKSNEISFGDQCIVGGSDNTMAPITPYSANLVDNVVYGNSNTIRSNRAYQNFIIGASNAINFMSGNLSGESSLGPDYSDAYQNFMTGSNNKIYAQTYQTAVFGASNTVSPGAGTNRYQTSYTILSGSYNTIRDNHYSIISGTNNVGNRLNSSLLIGSYNKVSDESNTTKAYTYNSIIAGNNNTIGNYDVNNSLIIGNNNNMNVSTSNSIIYGSYNRISSSNSVTYSLIGGYNNSCGQISYSALVGQDCSSGSVNYCLISGYKNSGAGMDYSIMGGYSNTATTTLSNSFMIGSTNVASGTSNSIIGGHNNIISTNSGGSLIVGSSGTIINSQYSIIGGTSNKVKLCSQSVLVGYNNDASNSDTITASFLNGQNNTIAGVVTNSYVNGISSNLNEVISTSIVSTDSGTLNSTVTGSVISGSNINITIIDSEEKSVNLANSLIVGEGLNVTKLSPTDTADCDGYTILGQYNVDEDKIFIVGNGTDSDNRKNAMTIDHNNNMTVSGTVNVTDVENENTIVDLLAEIKSLKSRVQELENNSMPHVVLTQSEYDTMESHDENTLYIIKG